MVVLILHDRASWEVKGAAAAVTIHNGQAVSSNYDDNGFLSVKQAADAMRLAADTLERHEEGRKALEAERAKECYC